MGPVARAAALPVPGWVCVDTMVGLSLGKPKMNPKRPADSITPIAKTSTGIHARVAASCGTNAMRSRPVSISSVKVVTTTKLRLL